MRIERLHLQHQHELEMKDKENTEFHGRERCQHTDNGNDENAGDEKDDVGQLQKKQKITAYLPSGYEKKWKQCGIEFTLYIIRTISLLTSVIKYDNIIL